MPLLTGPACFRCGDGLTTPAAGNSSENLCRACRLAPPPFERAVAYTIYQDRMRDAIHALKYGHMRPAARRLGSMLAQAVAQLAGQAPGEMLVIPVPLHPSRYAQRGFNQARLLAAHAMKTLARTQSGWKLVLADDALLRHKATESQASLTPRQRRINLRGAFSVSQHAHLRGRHVLLIDDILTTGATARAAAATLRRGGAESVWVATLARARRIHPVSGFLEQDDADANASDLITEPGQLANSESEPEANMHSFGDHSSSLRGH